MLLEELSAPFVTPLGENSGSLYQDRKLFLVAFISSVFRSNKGQLCELTFFVIKHPGYMAVFKKCTGFHRLVDPLAQDIIKYIYFNIK